MITETVATLIRQARLANGSLGDGVTPSADETSDDMLALNLLLASWDMAIYTHTQESKALTLGVAAYTWGTGGDINTERPLDIVDQAFIRDGTQDSPVKLWTEREYNETGDKSSAGMPEYIYFKPSYPLAYIYLYPTPDAAYTIYLTSLKAMAELTSSTAEVSLSQEFAAAIKWNLAIELAPNYNVPVTPVMMGRAQQTKSIIINRAIKHKIYPAKFDDVTGSSNSGVRPNILS